MSGRICGECGGRAVLVVEPVGRYDFAGWADVPACQEHVGGAALSYLGELDRVQVRYLDAAQLPEVVTCCNDGCDRLVGDGFGMGLECDRALFGAES